MSLTLPRWTSTASARSPEGFESFYKDVRGRLLLQTYALTGDLHASQRAVRDALVVAWHHWRKVTRLDEPEDYVRPLAWARAQRRSSARWWARREDVDADARATLDALGKLSGTQRKVLLLTHLTSLPIDRMAREVGVTRATAERELQTASAQFAIHREVPSTAIRTLLEALAPAPGAVRWPRPSILMRAGSARRRAHTTVGVVVAVAAVAVSGSLVTDGAGARPELASKGILDGSTSPAPTRASTPAPPPPDPLTPEALLALGQVQTAYPGSWTEGPTSTNTEGDGLVFTCQAHRYADTKGIGALVRTFTAPVTPKATGPATVGQTAEASADVSAAEKTYRTTVGWYAGCESPRVQLLATRRVVGVGDEATLMVLRAWNDPATTQVVGVARTGGLTTTVVDTRPAPKDPTAETPDAVLQSSAQLLATAVTGLCTLPDHGDCAASPQLKDASPAPVGRHPELLVEADLPPVPGITQPWVGTRARKVQDNPAATRCDKTTFTEPGVTGARTRTFVIPDATQLPVEFGLAETTGALPRKQAQQFVDDIRSSLDGCTDEVFGTDVERLAQEESGPRDLSVWRLTVEVSEKRSVRYLMAVVREGNAVAQLSFVPADDVSIGPEAFIALAHRAQERLGQLTTTTP
jgi:DNA-directed RNA polymerase specialized sigma24 family protein